jgi:hypothetical protein
MYTFNTIKSSQQVEMEEDWPVVKTGRGDMYHSFFFQVVEVEGRLLHGNEC